MGKYEEALEKARSGKSLEEIFPELKESEDERIRKAIVRLLTVASESYLIDATGFKKEQFLSYLEKQKEQKGANGNEKEIPNGQKPAVWSEEDERMRNQLVYDVEYQKKEGLVSAKKNKVTKALYKGLEECYDEKIAWLKSLPLNLKKKNDDVAKLCSNEWSEEEQQIIENAACTLISFSNIAETKEEEEELCELASKLQDLKPQPLLKTNKWRRYIWAVNLRFNYDGLVRYEDNGSYEIVTAGNKPKRQVNGEYILLKDISPVDWKPSKEQMRYLKKVYESYDFCDGERDALESIYNDLKKLL